MAVRQTVIEIPPEPPGKSALRTAAPSTVQEATSSSWLPSSWFPSSSQRLTVPEKPAASKPNQVLFEEPETSSKPLRKKQSHSLSVDDFSEKPAVLLPLKDRPTRHESVSAVGREPSGKGTTSKTEEPRKKSKVAPPIPGRTGTMQSNFSYDTLKERADVWKKERSKRPSRLTTAERQDSFVEQIPDQTKKHPEFMEETSRPKIRFTPEESDKVDKDILRLMGALEDSRYPFNRDKHLLFNKLRLIRRKQMGLLFAHRELDGTGYFDTDREEFGCDVISDQFGTMYNVIDAISRDVYELRELLYYERKNQTPPVRRGSSDRRTSSEPPPAVHISKPTPFPTRTGNAPLSSYDGIDGSALPISPTLLVASSPKPASSPTRPILKHALSTESFKSAKSDDTVTDD